MALFSDGDAGGGRGLRALAFVGSAAGAAFALHFAWDEPLIALGALSFGLGALGVRWLSQRRLKRLLRSGDVDSVLARWSPSFARVPHAPTMAPLMMATAFASYGWIAKAREAMAAAERGPAWDAAIEHRLFLDALLLTFEGDREGALDRSTRLSMLPLPPSGSILHGRMATLRAAVGALARAFAHETVAGDAELLEKASESSPLVFWAMRYAAAVVAVDRGDAEKVKALIEGAPRWPAESVFRAFHDEIAAQAGLPG